jgi:hypothetical protein
MATLPSLPAQHLVGFESDWRSAGTRSDAPKSATGLLLRHPADAPPTSTPSTAEVRRRKYSYFNGIA